MQAQAQGVDPISKKVKAGSQEMSYDYLVVATGGGMRLEEVPRLDVYAETIWTPAAMLRLRWAVQK
jgi:NADH dehydrogenase FAD-containing subunit